MHAHSARSCCHRSRVARAPLRFACARRRPWYASTTPIHNGPPAPGFERQFGRFAIVIQPVRGIQLDVLGPAIPSRAHLLTPWVPHFCCASAGAVSSGLANCSRRPAASRSGGGAVSTAPIVRRRRARPAPSVSGRCDLDCGGRPGAVRPWRRFKRLARARTLLARAGARDGRRAAWSTARAGHRRRSGLIVEGRRGQHLVNGAPVGEVGRGRRARALARRQLVVSRRVLFSLRLERGARPRNRRATSPGRLGGGLERVHVHIRDEPQMFEHEQIDQAHRGRGAASRGPCGGSRSPQPDGALRGLPPPWPRSCASSRRGGPLPRARTPGSCRALGVDLRLRRPRPTPLACCAGCSKEVRPFISSAPEHRTSRSGSVDQSERARAQVPRRSRRPWGTGRAASSNCLSNARRIARGGARRRDLRPPSAPRAVPRRRAPAREPSGFSVTHTLPDWPGAAVCSRRSSSASLNRAQSCPMTPVQPLAHQPRRRRRAAARSSLMARNLLSDSAVLGPPRTPTRRGSPARRSPAAPPPRCARRASRGFQTRVLFRVAVRTWRDGFSHGVATRCRRAAQPRGHFSLFSWRRLKMRSRFATRARARAFCGRSSAAARSGAHLEVVAEQVHLDAALQHFDRADAAIALVAHLVDERGDHQVDRALLARVRPPALLDVHDVAPGSHPASSRRFSATCCFSRAISFAHRIRNSTVRQTPCSVLALCPLLHQLLARCGHARVTCQQRRRPRGRPRRRRRPPRVAGLRARAGAG